MLILKIVVQVLAVIIALLVNNLDYVVYDKRTIKFKFSRKWLFKLTIVFLALSIAFTIIEDINNNKKEEAQSKQIQIVQTQNNELQNQLNRAANQIRNISIAYNLSNPLNTSSGIAYRNRMLRDISVLGKQGNRLWEMGIVMGEGGNVQRLAVTKSPYTPDLKKDPGIFHALNLVGVDVEFYRKPVSIEDLKNKPDYYKNPNNEPKSNLRIKVFGSLQLERHSYQNPPNSQMQLIYEFREDRFTINANNLTPVVQINDGQITSIPDLAGSQMIVWIGIGIKTDNEKITEEMMQIYRLSEIKDFIIEMSEGRKFNLSRKDFQVFSNKDGDYFYVYQFPSAV